MWKSALPSRGAHSYVQLPARIVAVLLVATLVYGVTPAGAKQLSQVAQVAKGQDVYAAATLTSGDTDGGSVAGSAGGTATFAHGQNGDTQVTVIVSGPLPGAQYGAAITDGSCAGTVLHDLGTLQLAADGTVSVVTSLPGSVEFGRWYVRVDATGGEPGTANLHELCGVVNPALASGPVLPGSGAGMPSTGHSEQTTGRTLILLLVVAAGAVVGGCYLTAGGRRAQNRGAKGK